MEEFPEDDGIGFTSTEVEVRNVIVTSVDHSGATSVCNTLVNWMLRTPEGKVVEEMVLTSSKESVCYKPIEVPMTNKNMILSLIDVSSPLINQADCNNVVSIHPDIHAVLICVPVSRWSKSFLENLVALYNYFSANGISRDNIYPCFTHLDYKSQLPIEIFRQYKEMTGFVGDKYLFGSFIDLNLVTNLGVKVLSPYIEESKNRCLEFLSSSTRSTKHRFVINKGLKVGSPKSVKLVKKAYGRYKAEDIEIKLEDEADFSSRTRKVLMVGLTGSGKSSLINGLGYKEKSQSSLKPVTMNMIRARDRQITLKSGGKFILTMCDTIGVGDVVHSTEELKNEILFFIQSDLPIINLIIITMKFDPFITKIHGDVLTLVTFLDKVLSLKKDNLLFVVTHVDFYNENVIGRYRKKLKQDVSLADDSNILFVMSPTVADVDPQLQRNFSVVKKNTMTKIVMFIAKSESKIEAQYKARRFISESTESLRGLNERVSDLNLGEE